MRNRMNLYNGEKFMIYKKHEKIKRKKSCENCYSKTYFEFQASKDIPKSFKLKLLSNIIEF